MTEDEMVGWYHQFYGHEFEQALEVADGQGSLACCSPRGDKDLDATEQLNRADPSSLLLQNLLPVSRLYGYCCRLVSKSW